MTRAVWWLACWPEDHPAAVFVLAWLAVFGAVIAVTW